MQSLNNKIELDKSKTNKQTSLAISKALNDLLNNGSLGVPTQDKVLKAPNGSHWSGWKKNNQDRWLLVKHGPDSYNAEF